MIAHRRRRQGRPQGSPAAQPPPARLVGHQLRGGHHPDPQREVQDHGQGQHRVQPVPGAAVPRLGRGQRWRRTAVASTRSTWSSRSTSSTRASTPTVGPVQEKLIEERSTTNKGRWGLVAGRWLRYSRGTTTRGEPRSAARLSACPDPPALPRPEVLFLDVGDTLTRARSVVGRRLSARLCSARPASRSRSPSSPAPSPRRDDLRLLDVPRGAVRGDF